MDHTYFDILNHDLRKPTVPTATFLLLRLLIRAAMGALAEVVRGGSFAQPLSPRLLPRRSHPPEGSQLPVEEKNVQ